MVAGRSGTLAVPPDGTKVVHKDDAADVSGGSVTRPERGFVRSPRKGARGFSYYQGFGERGGS